MTETVEKGKRRSSSDLTKILLIFLALAIGFFLWQFVGDYSNNIYVQSSPIIGIFADFRVATNLIVVIGLALTLVVARARRQSTRPNGQ